MVTDFFSLAPNELNRHLKDASGKGLFPYTEALRIVLCLGYFDKNGNIISWGWGDKDETSSREWERLEKRLKTLKKKCIEDIIDYDCAISGGKSIAARAYYLDGDEGIGANSILRKYVELNDFCYFLHNTISRVISQRSLRNIKKGAPIEKLNLLFAFWGSIWNHHREKRASNVKAIDWELLTNMFEWFWHRLNKYELYEAFKPKTKDLDPEYFRNQFYKHRIRNAKILKQCLRKPYRRGFLVWLGMRRPFIYRWSEIADMNISDDIYDPYLDDKKTAIESLRKALAGKDRFREAVMLPDYTFTID